VSASIAATIAGRPLLPGLDGDWIERRREALHGVRMRALDCLADVAIANQEPALAAQFAEEAVSLEPFREGAWRRLIRAHQGVGDRVAAVRAYPRCRRLLADELGVTPSSETEALHRALREDR
jgi:DNA-binding SARP family transcriptional activator